MVRHSICRGGAWIFPLRNRLRKTIISCRSKIKDLTYFTGGAFDPLYTPKYNPLKKCAESEHSAKNEKETPIDTGFCLTKRVKSSIIWKYVKRQESVFTWIRNENSNSGEVRF